jgi:hypothetical protein
VEPGGAGGTPAAHHQPGGQHGQVGHIVQGTQHCCQTHATQNRGEQFNINLLTVKIKRDRIFFSDPDTQFFFVQNPTR